MMNKGGNFEVPDDMRKLLDQGVSQAREGFEKVMNAAGQAVDTIDAKAGSAQGELADMRKKSLAFTENSIAAAFDHAQKLVGAKSLDEVMKLQADYLAKQFESVRSHAQAAGQDITQKAKAATAEMMEEGARASAKAKDVMAQGIEAVKKATTPKK
jgi:phasin